MQHLTFKQTWVKAFALITLCLSVLSVSANVGLDSYEVYLNNKLILKQYVNQPLNLRKLALDKASPNDQLVVHYKSCHQDEKGGTSRRLVIEDEKGNVLKKWEFPDGFGSKSGMTIQVKELLELEKKGDGLKIYYVSNETPKPEMLAALQLNGKSTAFRSAKDN